MAEEHEDDPASAAKREADERRAGRSNVLLGATIEQNGARMPVRVSNLSANGALVIGDRLPVADTNVTFHCNGFAIESFVIWSRDRHAGLEFATPVPPEALGQRAPQPRIAITKDTRNVDFRRPGFRGNQMTDEEQEFFDELTRPPPDDPDKGP